MKTAFSVSVPRLGSGLLVELVCIASLYGFIAASWFLYGLFGQHFILCF